MRQHNGTIRELLKKPVWERLLVAFAAAVTFGGTLKASFVYDDFFLFHDASIVQPSGWLRCWRPIQTRPLTWFTFWVSDRLDGANPFGWHLAGLALHVTCALLVLDILRKLIAPRAAFIAATIFAIHPFMAEPVAYVFARATLLGALFSLLAIRSWIANRPWIAVLWFAAAMLAKEEYAAVPLLLGVLDFSRRATLRWRPLVQMVAITALLGLRTIWATFEIPGSQAGPHAGISPARYLLSQGCIVLDYLRRFVVPWGFSIDHSASPAPAILALLAWTALAAMATVALFYFRRLRAGFWFLAGLIVLAPSSSIFPVADLASDHRMYLPLAAFAACAGLMLERLDARVLAGIAIALIAISLRYTYVWISPERLWQEAVREAPGALRPRIQLARSCPPDEALEVLDQARAIFPNDPAVPAEQGRILLSLNRPGDALVSFGRALALDPSNPVAMNNRGVALLALGQIEPARDDFRRALARDPCQSDARYNLSRTGVPVPSSANCPAASDQEKTLQR